MPHYRVELNGENYWLDYEGTPCRMGFYTVRFVEAASVGEAAEIAQRVVRADPKFASALNSPADPPTVVADGIEEVEPGEIPDVTPGYAFYAEEDDG